ncbi:MAG: hypothetical protein OES09_16460 [Gammaproteobacteria bacterium]|nr:hypothetical protein [Gammaproteobacteria bacterium]
MRTPQTEAEFLDLVGQAIFETEELVVCVTEDLDDETADLSATFAGLAHGLRTLEQDVRRATHCFANGRDLRVMGLAHTYRHVIPFYGLLDALNRAHRQGVTPPHRPGPT